MLFFWVIKLILIYSNEFPINTCDKEVQLMAHRITITLDDEAFAFLNQVVGKNRSPYINQLLKKELRNTLKEALLKANQEEADDADYQQELKLWN